MTAVPARGLQLRSLMTADGKLQISLEEDEVAAPGPDQVVVRVDGTPINPTDLAVLTGLLDMTPAVQGQSSTGPTLSIDVPAGLLRAMKSRVGKSLRMGAEGTGIVVEAGSSSEAQALVGKRVAFHCGVSFAEYVTVNTSMCVVLPDNITAAQGASCFVNPLTALSFIETMQAGGHQAIVHTAAASNLGQMLNRICIADGIPLVNIVRKEEQASLLLAMGAEHVVNSSDPDFMENLIGAIMATGATLAFDAVGGGPLAGQILAAMNTAATRKTSEFLQYGTGQEMHVYIYGRLDLSPTTIPPGVGFTWNLGGYLLMPVLQKLGTAVRERMQQRIVDELQTTFASHYSKTISLREAIDYETVLAYNARATGEKYLIDPTR